MLVDALRLRLLRQIDETKSTVMELTLPRQRASISASASPTHLGSQDPGVMESEPVVDCLQVLQLKRDTSPEGIDVLLTYRIPVYHARLHLWSSGGVHALHLADVEGVATKTAWFGLQEPGMVSHVICSLLRNH